MSKTVDMEPVLPKWSDKVLRGLAYWIGYKKQLYDFYPIREGELVGEALSLLSSKLDNDFRLNAEVKYRDMCVEWKKDNGKK